MLVSDFLEASAAKFPRKVGLVDRGRRLTYLEIEEQSNRKPGSRLTEKDIIRQAANRLESFKVPKFVEFRRELPRSSHGKVSKRELR